MQANPHLLSKLPMTSRQLYAHGFSAIAVFMMILALVCTGLIQAKGGYSRSGYIPLKAMTALPSLAAERSNWHEAQSRWLSAQAADVSRALRAGGIRQVAIYSRVKSYDSALEKAHRKGVPMHELHDLYGMRIVVTNELDVYRCLNHICRSYSVEPGSLKNYIISPKASGYQSVHVVTRMDDIHRVEFQIRTKTMHQHAEAEHEEYKARMRAA